MLMGDNVKYIFIGTFTTNKGFKESSKRNVTTPTTSQHNLNNVAWLDTKMTVQTPPHHTHSTLTFRSLSLTYIDLN